MSRSDERRGFYRIEDEISLQMFPISANEESAEVNEVDRGLPPEFTMLHELRRLENDNAKIFRLIQDKSPNIGMYFKVQNQKIDLIAQYLIKQASDEAFLQKVNISGSGLSVFQQEQLDFGSVWLLKIMVFPECYGFSCTAKVVSCDAQNKGYQVGLEFTDIPDNAQDELIRHITQMQSKELRKQRLSD